MYLIAEILKNHDINVSTINTPKGVLILADNGDDTYTVFNINDDLKTVYTYLGY